MAARHTCGGEASPKQAQKMGGSADPFGPFQKVVYLNARPDGFSGHGGKKEWLTMPVNRYKILSAMLGQIVLVRVYIKCKLLNFKFRMYAD